MVTGALNMLRCVDANMDFKHIMTFNGNGVGHEA